ncbi:hypothetical protein PAPYR_2963 [Paratrimastix pyriformis]|uniref:Uncharacterized protein n=1 Tax=Paratrimastix pyriformis TaxID=342808 RepID=A0ABQ8UT65_9EUKA|nr:hypothetical protein PAPYR_2963 [Paratrimastix pyriformis]
MQTAPPPTVDKSSTTAEGFFHRTITGRFPGVRAVTVTDAESNDVFLDGVGGPDPPQALRRFTPAFLALPDRVTKLPGLGPIRTVQVDVGPQSYLQMGSSRKYVATFMADRPSGGAALLQSCQPAIAGALETLGAALRPSSGRGASGSHRHHHTTTKHGAPGSRSRQMTGGPDPPVASASLVASALASAPSVATPPGAFPPPPGEGRPVGGAGVRLAATPEMSTSYMPPPGSLSASLVAPAPLFAQSVR